MKFKEIKYLTAIMALAIPMMNVNASTTSNSEQLMNQLMTATDVVSITNDEEIKLYMEATNQTFDPNVVEIIYIPGEDLEEDRKPMSDGFFSDLYVKNLQKYQAVRHDQVLDTRKVPAGGELKFDDTYDCDNRVDLDIYMESNVSPIADFLSDTFNYEIYGTETVRCRFIRTYPYAVKADVYPLFEVRVGEVWDKDIKYDDYDADFILEKALGTSVAVTRL